MNELIEPRTDPIWHKLSTRQREEVSTWVDAYKRYRSAPGKATLERLRFECEPRLGYVMTRSTTYRVFAEIDRNPIEAVLGAAAVRRARGVKKSTNLPPLFVSWIRSQCGDMQRRKFLPVWRNVIDNYLRLGKVIPGYDADWRGIWADEHAGHTAPECCPYNDIVQGWEACQPAGWSYSNLLKYAPEHDVWAGAAVGVHAMRAYTPQVPHTRYGMRPMMAVTMDDVDPDVYCWYAGEAEARRPIGLGILDIATGCMVGFTLVPRIKDPTTGVVSGLKAFWNRYIWANVFCGIGIDREAGLTGLLEHGTASLSDADVFRINKLLGPGPITNYPPTQAPNDFKGVWFVVQRSSTSGAPIMQGLFTERAKGVPTWKAPIESLWNRLHNEVAMLPGQSGKDWDNAPQHVSGWQKEDKALVEIQSALATCPQAVDILKTAQTHALSYQQLDDAFKTAIAALNNRRQHSIQEFEKCGYVKHMVEVGGALVPMDQAAADLAGDDPELLQMMLARLAPKQKVSVMSPAEAWASHDKKLRKTFGGFVACEIMGEELSQVVTVTARGEIFAQNHWNGEWLQYSAMIDQPDGVASVFPAGQKLRVWVNPTNVNLALVCQMDGAYVGTARFMAPAPFHRPQEATTSMGEVARQRAAQKSRLSSVVAGRYARENERRESNRRAIQAALTAAETPTTFRGVESADVLGLTDAKTTEGGGVVGSKYDEDEDSFLSRMNRTH